MSAVQIVGFVKGDWPAVLDHELQPNALALLTVNSEGAESYYFRLDPSRAGRQLITLKLPARFGSPPRIGLYTISVFQDAPGELTPAGFHIYGIGAGPRAVGSVALEELHFTPQQVAPQRKEKALYSFRSKNHFNKVSAEFVKVEYHGKIIIARMVNSEPLKGVEPRAEPYTGQWDGKAGKEAAENKGKISQGTHLLQIRAWVGDPKVADWVAVWSSDIVRVE
jgi:hypothetical protein